MGNKKDTTLHSPSAVSIEEITVGALLIITNNPYKNDEHGTVRTEVLPLFEADTFHSVVVIKISSIPSQPPVALQNK